jgi:hypothetical protein
MPPPKKRKGRPAARETARATGKENEQLPETGTAANPIQTEAYNGSFGASDPDRPRWGMDTRLAAEFHYERADGTYDFTVLKGRDTKGQKHFLKGRRFQGGISDLQMAKHDPQRFEFYKYPGL